MTTHLKLGTRRSLLAMAQSKLVARELEQQNPDLTIELVGIETRGDRTLDVPLSSMEGKDFFVAELDRALLNGEIDFSVHSMKDLSLERPDSIALAAVPTRANPRDIVLFSPGIVDKLKAGHEIRLGTCSPRRMENVPPFLARALPQLGMTPNIICREIRGNVHTRIGRLHADDDDPQKVDAVVLAFAGLIRLWQDADGQQALSSLLTGLRWMVLPLKECPAAPAQGALAVECRSSDKTTLDLLKSLHHEQTSLAVGKEREVLADWGGGCHQSLGATAEAHAVFGGLMYLRGRTPEGTLIAATRWGDDQSTLPGPHWDGSHWREASFSARYYEDLAPPGWIDDGGALLIAHSRALPTSWVDTLRKSPQRVWTSGVRSWYRLAAKGIWVEGCAEELGFEGLGATVNQPVLQLPNLRRWKVLTHADGADSWPGQTVVATYVVEPATGLDESHPAVRALQSAKSAFWSSGSQYELFRQWIPAECWHASRFGKTYNYLQEQIAKRKGHRLTAFPSASDWRSRTRNSYD